MESLPPEEPGTGCGGNAEATAFGLAFTVHGGAPKPAKGRFARRALRRAHLAEGEPEEQSATVGMDTTSEYYNVLLQ